MKNWKSLHFIIYLYISIGKSDYSLVEEEIDVIFKNIKGLANYSLDEVDEAYKEVLKYHNTQTDIEIIRFIKENHLQFYTSEEDKMKLLKGLEQVMEADGIVKDVEMIMYRYIKKTIAP